jgi:hypothetical protein
MFFTIPTRWLERSVSTPARDITELRSMTRVRCMASKVMNGGECIRSTVVQT